MAPVVFTWRGVDYTLPASRVMRLGAELEEMLYTQRGNAWEMISGRIAPNINMLAMAYGHALRTAGAKIADEDVRAAMFYDGGDFTERMSLALNAMAAIMSPPAPLEMRETPDAEKPKAGRKAQKSR